MALTKHPHGPSGIRAVTSWERVDRIRGAQPVTPDTLIRRAMRAVAARCWLITLIAACGAGLLGACGRSPDRDDARSGVISVPSESDRPLPWSVSLEREIFRESRDSTPFETITESMVAVGPRGTIYVYDDIDGMVHLFDSVGGGTGRLGARGSGPGEMRAPTAIAVDHGGDLWVFDLAKRGFVRFSPEGVVLPEVLIAAVHAGGPVRFDGVTLLLSIVEADTRTRKLRKSLVRLQGQSMQVVTSVEEALPRGQRFGDCPVPIVVPRLFEPILRWSTAGNTLAFVRTAEYRIEVQHDGAAFMTVGRDISPSTATADAAAAELLARGASFKASGCNIPVGTLVKAGGFAEHIPVIADLVLAPDGALWVRRRGQSDGEGPIDVFTSAGAYEGSLPPQSPFPALFVSLDHFLAVRVDSEGSGHLGLYVLNCGLQACQPGGVPGRR